MTLIEQAKRYCYEEGFSVFPLVYRGKVPFRGWKWQTLQHRTPTEQELESWFTMRVNIAIVTGDVSGSLQVLDFDDMNVFQVWWEKTMLQTRFVWTGKGVHLYFRLTDGHGYNGDFTVDGKHAGQARYNGGYVVAPPSVHPSGRLYTWTSDAPVLTVSFNTLHIEPKQQRLGKTQPMSTNVKKTPPTSTTTIKHPERYAKKAVFLECEQVSQAGEGQRNTVLYRASLKVKKHAIVLGEEAVKAALKVAGMTAGLSEHEVLKTIENAWKVARY